MKGNSPTGSFSASRTACWICWRDWFTPRSFGLTWIVLGAAVACLVFTSSGKAQSTRTDKQPVPATSSAAVSAGAASSSSAGDTLPVDKVPAKDTAGDTVPVHTDSSPLPPVDEKTFRQNYYPFTAEDERRPSPLLLVSGDYRGKLSPCGCPRLRMGGLPWRMDFLERLRNQSGARIFQFDTGGTLALPGLPPEFGVVYTEYLLSALGRAGWTALNVTPSEAVLLDRLWKIEPPDAAGQNAGKGKREDETLLPAETLAIWRQWLPRTFHLLGPSPSALSGFEDIRKVPPPAEAIFPSIPLPAFGASRDGDRNTSSPPVALFSANLRHPALPSHYILSTDEGDWLVTGLSMFSAGSEIAAVAASLPAPWQVHSAEKGWEIFFRDILPGLEKKHRLRGVLVLLWGEADIFPGLSAHISSDLSARYGRSATPGPDSSDRALGRTPAMLFYSLVSSSSDSRPPVTVGLPSLPVGVEGRFMALAYPLPSGIEIRPVAVTGQFRPADVSSTVWDRVMEVAFLLQSHLSLRFLESLPPSGKPTGGNTSNPSAPPRPSEKRFSEKNSHP